jgi:hypothetical protein
MIPPEKFVQMAKNIPFLKDEMTTSGNRQLRLRNMHGNHVCSCPKDDMTTSGHRHHPWFATG